MPADLSVEGTAGGAGPGDRDARWTLSPGATLGGYRVVEPLGRGGMGEVYLVENVEMGKRYALKVVPSELARDEEFRERFRREARVMADLSHPNIVGVHHMAEEGGMYFLVMDYVTGPDGGPRTLADSLGKREKLPEDEARRIALEIASALEAAHARGVVHRDMKPANVLLDARGRARVSDFGLARVVGDEFMKSLAERSMSLSAAPTEAGARSASEKSVIGTYDYMSPEQKAGRTADARSDVYALGLVIYRMLTGRRAEGAFDTPSELGCSKAWDGIVRRCLRQRPIDRYPSAADLARDLRAAGRGGRGGPLAMGAAAAAVIVAAAVVGLWYLNVPKEPVPATKSVLAPVPGPVAEPAAPPMPAAPEPKPVAAAVPEPAGPRVALPSLATLDGLDIKKAGPPDDGPPGAEKWLRKVTVTVPAKGAPEVTGVADASRWRGIALPRDVGQNPILKKVEQPTEIRVKIYWANDKGQVIYSDKAAFPADWPGVAVPLSIAGAHIAMKVNKLPIQQTPAGIPDLNELARILRDLAARNAMPVVIDARAAVPFRWVMGVLDSCLRAEAGPVKFQAPPPAGVGVDDWWWGSPDGVRATAGIFEDLKGEASRARRDAQGLPNVCVRIRADANAPYSAVQGVMVAAMRAYIWRLSFAGIVDGKEVEIGPVYDAPGLPALKEEPVVFIHEEVEVTEVEHPVFGHQEIDLPDDIEHPVFIHEEAEVVDHMETEDTEDTDTARGQEDAISDIPLGGTGIVGNLGVGGGGRGVFGFRIGGGRIRAALKHGGSRASEATVDAALRWLARHQEADGRWDGETKYEPADPGKNTDPGVTGLALLAFLGAGHTEKVGRYASTVRKGVSWLISQQAANGSIGGGFDGGLGYHHAIAGLALAEASGMARVPETTAAAWKAVDYSIGAHQTPRSGWRYQPRQAADTSVTVWFVMQLKSAKVAGLPVDGAAFQGAASFLDTVTTEKDGRKGLVAYQPGRTPTPTPTMTAAGMVCRQLMGWRHEDPALVGAADFLTENLPAWGGGEVNFYYWYHGTLAMFQMGGDRWEAWNKALRDTLISRQVNDPNDVRRDGSWDPVGAWCASGGRVYSTAMAALCLEVYYRYLPLYEK